eukprot:1234063-Rhodomonas_salina.1
MVRLVQGVPASAHSGTATLLRRVRGHHQRLVSLVSVKVWPCACSEEPTFRSPVAGLMLRPGGAPCLAAGIVDVRSAKAHTTR